MNDIILKSYLDDFANKFEYSDIKESLQFEYFVTHCLVSRDYQGHFDAENLSAGDANGIDSIAIFVNDILIEDAAEIEGLAKHNIEVRFLFIQSKTSSSYDQGELLKFTQAVRQFFSKDAKPASYALGAEHDIKEAIYRKAIKFVENPRVDFCYVTTSAGRPNELISETAFRETGLLEATSLFSTVNFEFVNSEDLKSIYRRLSNKVTKQITFEKHTILPKIQGVKRAFIGILPCKEYLKLICDDDGKLLKNVFYDNVRDFQGENSVNREILSTLASDGPGRETFVLLNNGVTVVCKAINPVGFEFTVRDFQVVNGCQTSHVLHRNAELLSGNEFVTIKLIETEDVDIANKITKATNRQTEVKLEAFAGLQPFHKELEAFYASVPLSERLYYERRPGQYDFDSTIKHNRIISIPSQIKSFLSVFLDEPHKIHFYYGQLLSDYSSGNESSLFSETHDPYPYYSASYLIYLISEKIKRSNSVPVKWKYHIAVIVRMLATGPFNSKRLSDPAYCKRYCDALHNTTKNFNDYFRTAVSLLTAGLKTREGKRNSRDLPQDAALTKELLEQAKRIYLERNKETSNRLDGGEGNFDGTFVGSICQTVPEKKFGFIEYGQRQFFFTFETVKYTQNQKVRFKVRKSGDTFEAFDVVAL
ncbi:AIPR family protein [Burkholderia diffusa]|uniref:AIPR family protein n=1 Tax=Burkholderia diffusa TaxID=488732 RepID=UPI0009BF2F3B|nr:AIPR family protein [Burkholderia diffusa]